MTRVININIDQCFTDIHTWLNFRPIRPVETIIDELGTTII